MHQRDVISAFCSVFDILTEMSNLLDFFSVPDQHGQFFLVSFGTGGILRGFFKKFL